jgi:hypothetical protein
MQPIGLTLVADDHLGGVLGDDGPAELIHVEVGAEQDDLVSPVAQPLGGVACAIGIEPTHHDTPSGHAHSVTPRRERPHTPTRAVVAQTSLHSSIKPVISPHSLGCHFDVTRESLRLIEFLLSTRRFPA